MVKTVAWAIVLALPGMAQFGTKQTQFRNAVQSWSGHIDVHGVGSGTTTGPAGSTAKYNIDQQVTGDVNLNQYNPQTGAWTGTLANGKITISETATVTFVCTTTTVLTASSTAQTDALGKPLIFNLSFDTHSDTWSFWPSSEYILGTQKGSSDCGTGSTPTSTNDKQQSRFMPINLQMGIPFPATGFDLAGSFKSSCGCGTVVTGDVLYTFTYNLKAVTKQLELTVDPDGYDTWRPEAGMTEDTPANTISIKATLRYTDGSALPSTTGLTKVSFQLLNVSHQPGVAMNFPIQNAKATPDLQFTADSNANLTVTGNEKNQADTHATQLLTTATAVVTSFDWGAWGEIKVTGSLQDGSPIVGHLTGDTAQQNVRLPKRVASSFIADLWKSQKGMTGKPDNDDSEQDPVGLKNCNGDGLTLYQEYRGFYENGKHIEGNPLKKDFFIRNMAGAEAEAGIWLFTELSGLEVHKDLTENELIFPDRRINGNVDGQTPQLAVFQHGVGIATCARQDGAGTYVTQANVRGRPGLTVGICMQGRFEEGLTLTKPYRQSEVDQATAYDRAVAHEFFHSVGVEHHGDFDTGILATIHGPQDPTASFATPQITWGPDAILILDETTGQDVSAAWYASTLAAAQTAGIFSDPWTQRLYVGVSRGQHSGDDQCVMRYSIAQIYPMGQGENSIYYSVPEGSEPAGLQICSTTAGTGVNAVDRQPRSRYFDTMPHHGNCRFWVCVNDSVPPDPDFFPGDIQ